MGFFGNLFGGSNQPQTPDPDTSSTIEQPPTNPYNQNPGILGAIRGFVGDPAELAREAARTAASQEWQGWQDWAKAQQPHAPAAPPQGLSVTDGNTALGGPPMKDYTASPGPMDQIAAAAQQGPTTGGSSLVDTGPGASQVMPQTAAPGAAPGGPPMAGGGALPPASIARTPTPMDLINSGAAARARAMGVDVSRSFGDYDQANPGYQSDNTPQYWQDPNGGRHMTVNRQDSLIAQPPVLRDLPNADGSVGIHALDQSDLYPAQAAPAAAPQSGPPLRSGAQSPVQVATPPISHNEAIQALQVAIAEDPHNIPGVVSTIINRAAASGKTVNQVLQEKGQFETVGNGSAARVDPSKASAAFQDPQVQAIFNGQIPSQFAGVTSFYAPKAQAALGRPKPAWDDGTGFDSGNTRFFARPYEGRSPNPIASSAPPTVDGSTPDQSSGPPQVGGGRVITQSQGLGLDSPAMQSAIDRDAQVFNQTGTPPRSPGKNSTLYQFAVKQRAAERVQQGLDTGGSLAQAQTNFGANKQTLADIQKDALSTGVNVQRAHEQAGFVMDLLGKGAGPTGSPWLNMPIQVARKNGLGDTDVAKLNQAFGTLQDDYGTVMGGGNSELTDSKQREAKSRVDIAASQGTLGAVIPQMLAEMDRAQSVKTNAYQYMANKYGAGSPSGVGLPTGRQLSGATASSPNAAPPMKNATAQRFSPQDAAKLPSGTRFVGLDGVERIKH